MILNENPNKSKATSFDDLHDKLMYILYSSTNDDYCRNYSYYEKAYVQPLRLDFLRDRYTYWPKTNVNGYYKEVL